MIPNLKKLYGKDFRVNHERFVDGKPVDKTDPWLMTLESSLGHVYVYSEKYLGFSSDKNRPSLRKIPELKLIQDGDDGQNYIFKKELFPKLATKLKLKRKRRPNLSAKEREKRSKRMKKWHEERRKNMSIE